MAFVRPTFQPQNPAKSDCRLGWLSCTCFSAAMAASFDRQVPKIVTGCEVRARTGDTVGGTNLAQVDAAVKSLTGVDLSVYYRLSWATFAKFIDSGMGGILQGWYGPIADSRFDAGRGFRGNHAVFVPPDWAVMDPLADGRAAGVYKFHAEPYPRSLLRDFAGRLNIAFDGYRALGDGLVYAALTRDQVHSYSLAFTGGAFWIYELSAEGKITGRHSKRFSGPTSASCTIPQFYAWPGHSGRTLVRMLTGGLKGQYVGIPQDTVKLVTTP